MQRFGAAFIQDVGSSINTTAWVLLDARYRLAVVSVRYSVGRDGFARKSCLPLQDWSVLGSSPYVRRSLCSALEHGAACNGERHDGGMQTVPLDFCGFLVPVRMVVSAPEAISPYASQT